MSFGISEFRPRPPSTLSNAAALELAEQPLKAPLADVDTPLNAGRLQLSPQENEWQVISDGKFVGDEKFGDRNLLAEMPKAPPKGYDGDFTSPLGARDTMIEVCRNFTKQFVDEEGIKAKLDECRKQMEGLPEDSPRRAKLEERLAALEAHAGDVIKGRKNLCRFVPTRSKELLDPNTRVIDRMLLAKKEINTARMAIRDLEYDIARTHGKYGKGMKGLRFMEESLSPTRNRFLRAIKNTLTKIQLKCHAKLTGMKGLTEADLQKFTFVSKQRIESAEILGVEKNYNDFLGEIDAFSKACSGKPLEQDGSGGPQKAGQQHAEKALDSIKIFKEALYVKSGKGIDFKQSIEDTLAQTFSTLGKPGHMEFGLSVEGGVCVPLVAKAGGKYEYMFTVDCDAAGKLTITRSHTGGVKASAGTKIGNRLKAHASAEALLGKVDKAEYTSAASAAKELANGKLGAIDLFFAKGTQSVVKSLMKKAGKSALKLGAYSDQKFILAAQDHGLLKKTDTHYNFKGPNASYLSDFSGTRTKSKAGAGAGIGVIVHANAEATAAIMADAGTSTIHRSYYAYLTGDRIGEASTIYGRIASDACPLVNNESVKTLLNSKPTTPAEKQALAAALLKEVKNMIGLESEYTRQLYEGSLKESPNASTYCMHCRQATVALVALQDKFNSLGVPPNPEFAKSVDALQKNLVCPRGMALTKEQLLTELYVDRSYDKHYAVEKFHLGAGVEILADVTKGFEFGGGPSISADVTVEQSKGTDKRPFRAQTKVTIDFNLGPGVSSAAIVKAVQDAVRKTAGKTQMRISQQGMDPKSIISTLLSGMGSVVGGLSAGKDLAEMSQKEAEAHLATMLKLSTSSQTKLISLQIEDGRLTAVGIGKSATSSTDIPVIAGPIYFETEITRSSKSVTDNNYLTPSFDALLSRCDEHRVMGHVAEWSQFVTSKDNKKAFLRMAGIAGGKVPKDDKNAADDFRRISEQTDRMRKDIEACKHEDQRQRLIANLNRFLTASAELARYFADRDSVAEADEQRVLAQMRTMLDAAVDHYNILESVGGHIGQLAGDEVRKGLKTVQYDTGTNTFEDLSWNRI